MSEVLSPSIALNVNCDFADLGEFCTSSPDTSSTELQSPSSAYHCPPTRQRKLGEAGPDEIAEELEGELIRCMGSGECNLSRMGLIIAPANFPYKSLVTLLLSGNKIEKVPECLFSDGNCENLRQLDLSSNRLGSVPRSLFQLVKLEVLLLDQNYITEIPASAGDHCGGRFLPALQRIGLEFNDLIRFPIEFFDHCSCLREVYAAQNMRMLDKLISFHDFHGAAVVRSNRECRRVLLKVDNKPDFVQRMNEEEWTRVIPWLDVELHKIYPDRVLPFLYLGSQRTAQNPQVYRDLNIGAVLTAGRNLKVHLEPDMKHLVVPIEDLPDEQLRPVFDIAFRFIDEAREVGKSVLLHCFAGFSRSVTIVVAYMMNRHNHGRDEALELVRKVRPAAQPNEGFMEVLARYEQELKNLGRAERFESAVRV